MSLNTTNTTMRGVVWEGTPFSMTVTDLPVPRIQDPTDVVVRMTAAGICGTDLHTYHGIYGSTSVPWVMGHEGMGTVAAIGDAVQNLAVGDYVVIPDTGSAGHVDMDLAHGPSDGTIFGLGTDFGVEAGMQAEYLRVPFADDSLFTIPNATAETPASDLLSYLLVGDIFATAWTALDFSGFEPGDTVAVFGAGPVGLLATYSAVLRGASRVYSIDHVPARLQLAADHIGAIPINFADVDPVQRILELEPEGVTRSVDCVGFEAVDADLRSVPNVVINNMVAVTGNGGGIGQIGVFFAAEGGRNSSGIPRGSATKPTIEFPMVEFFNKGLTMRSGPVDVMVAAPKLMQLVASGRANVDFVISSLVGIEEAPEAYHRFDQHQETKAVIVF